MSKHWLSSSFVSYAPEKHLVFRQTLPFLYREEEWRHFPHDAAQPNFAILDELEKFRLKDGLFHFEMVWPQDKAKVKYEWMQTSNPTSSWEVEGYRSISAPVTSLEDVGGLKRSKTSLLEADHMLCVLGSFSLYWEGIATCTSQVQKQVELYAITPPARNIAKDMILGMLLGGFAVFLLIILLELIKTCQYERRKRKPSYLFEFCSKSRQRQCRLLDQSEELETLPHNQMFSPYLTQSQKSQASSSILTFVENDAIYKRKKFKPDASISSERVLGPNPKESSFHKLKQKRKEAAKAMITKKRTSLRRMLHTVLEEIPLEAVIPDSAFTLYIENKVQNSGPLKCSSATSEGIAASDSTVIDVTVDPRAAGCESLKFRRRFDGSGGSCANTEFSLKTGSTFVHSSAYRHTPTQYECDEDSYTMETPSGSDYSDDDERSSMTRRSSSFPISEWSRATAVSGLTTKSGVEAITFENWNMEGVNYTSDPETYMATQKDVGPRSEHERHRVVKDPTLGDFAYFRQNAVSIQKQSEVSIDNYVTFGNKYVQTQTGGRFSALRDSNELCQERWKFRKKKRRRKHKYSIEDIEKSYSRPQITYSSENDLDFTEARRRVRSSSKSTGGSFTNFSHTQSIRKGSLGGCSFSSQGLKTNLSFAQTGDASGDLIS